MQDREGLRFRVAAEIFQGMGRWHPSNAGRRKIFGQKWGRTLKKGWHAFEHDAENSNCCSDDGRNRIGYRGGAMVYCGVFGRMHNLAVHGSATIFRTGSVLKKRPEREAGLSAHWREWKYIQPHGHRGTHACRE